MSKNLEIKAICSDLKKTELIVKEIATEFLGKDSQIDTYFTTKHGRLKLRESSLSGTYLIPYLRPNQSEAKLSQYAKIDVKDSDNVKSLFKHLLGILCIVKKKRSIYLYKNVRIHLDRVEELGTFIEFEAVFDTNNSDEKKEQEKIKYLMQTMGITKKQLVDVSYENLINNKKIKY